MPFALDLIVVTALLLNNFYFLTVFVTKGFDLNCQPGDFDVLSGYRKQLSLPLPVHPVLFSSPPHHYHFMPVAAKYDSKF